VLVRRGWLQNGPGNRWQRSGRLISPRVRLSVPARVGPSLICLKHFEGLPWLPGRCQRDDRERTQSRIFNWRSRPSSGEADWMGRAHTPRSLTSPGNIALLASSRHCLAAGHLNVRTRGGLECCHNHSCYEHKERYQDAHDGYCGCFRAGRSHTPNPQ
jgi:hypothetical protein